MQYKLAKLKRLQTKDTKTINNRNNICQLKSTDSMELIAMNSTQESLSIIYNIIPSEFNPKMLTKILFEISFINLQ